MERLIAQLKLDEGFRKFPYKDTVGVDTIGYGYNMIADPLEILPDYLEYLRDNGITEESAERYLCQCVEITINDIRDEFPWFNSLPIIRREVLINMGYNIGIKRLSGFKKMLSALECGFYVMGAEEMLDSKWARQVGQRSKRLAEQMRTGVRQYG